MLDPFLSRTAFVTLLGALSLPASSSYVDSVAGREWAVHAATNVVAAQSVCDPVSGLCFGTAGGFDYTGWTWAKVADVNELYTNVGIPGFGGTMPASYSEIDSMWAPAFIDTDGSGPDAGYFAANLGSVEINARLLGGTTAARVIDNVAGSDVANTGLGAGFLATDDVWLYRTVPFQVPEPSPLLLAGLALIALSRASGRSRFAARPQLEHE